MKYQTLRMYNQQPLVASSGIEPESGASETLILSIVLRGQ
jgi:hypothetical protein